MSIPLVVILLAAPPPSVGGPSVGPQEEACKGRGAGDACTLPNQQLGICATSTCNRLDYSQGSPPKSIEAECLVCQQGGAGGPSPGDPPMVGSGGPPSEGGAGGEGKGEAADSASREPPTSSSRCRVDTQGPGGGWLGIALLTLIGLGRRRGRRSSAEHRA